MINIEISEDNKEKSAEKHQKMVSEFKKNQRNERTIIYIDGSKSESNQIRTGIVYTANFSYCQWKAWNLGSECAVFVAEHFAIKKQYILHTKKRMHGHEKSGFFLIAKLLLGDWSRDCWQAFK